MPQTLKDLVAAAAGAVERVDIATARRIIAEENALLLDVRDAPEIEKTGRAEGAHHVPRGMLEFRADASAPTHDPELAADRPVITYCAAGGRAALAGKTLQDMGFTRVYTLGSFKDWIESGGPVREGMDPGM